MKKDIPLTPITVTFSTPRSPHLRVTFGSDMITPIPPNGFALAARLHFMLSGHVAFPELNCPLLAPATEILAPQAEGLAFFEPDNRTKRDSLSMNS